MKQKGVCCDVDMASYSLVNTYVGRHGVTYPDMLWEPRESFRALAGYYAKPWAAR